MRRGPTARGRSEMKIVGCRSRAARSSRHYPCSGHAPSVAKLHRVPGAAGSARSTMAAEQRKISKLRIRTVGHHTCCRYGSCVSSATRADNSRGLVGLLRRIISRSTPAMSWPLIHSADQASARSLLSTVSLIRANIAAPDPATSAGLGGRRGSLLPSLLCRPARHAVISAILISACSGPSPARFCLFSSL